MAPPSALTIATQSVQRLVKEEKYYHSELESQRARVKKLEDEMGSGSADENAEFVLRQEVSFPFLLYLSVSLSPSPAFVSSFLSSYTLAGSCLA